MATAFRELRPNANDAPWSRNDRRWLHSHLAKSRCLCRALHHGRSLWLAGHPSLDDLRAEGYETILASLDSDVGQTVATVERVAGDLPQLQERVRRTAQAVLPAVVAIRNPVQKPSEMGRHQKNYASGVIITADGIVLSQWHVSHWQVSEDGDGATIRADSSPTCSAGDRTTIILHDGRECPAELLGANRTHDVSLLRLIEPGPYPHVPIRTTASVEVGDWVLKIGHPLGYRKGRSAPVRLGRVICGTEEIFGADYMWAGGDSGGPCFSLDGQLLGIDGSGGYSLVRMQLHDAEITRHAGGWRLSGVTGSKLIYPLLDAMRRGEVSPYDMEAPKSTARWTPARVYKRRTTPTAPQRWLGTGRSWSLLAPALSWC